MDAPTRRRSSAARLEVIRTAVDRFGGGAALLTSRADVAWATAGGQHHVVTSSDTGTGALLVTREAAWFVAPNIEHARLAEEAFDGLGLEVVAFDWWETDGLARCVDRLLDSRAKRLGLRSDADLEPELVAHRSRLDGADQERLARVGVVAAAAVDGALAAADVGMTEEQLAAGLLGRLVGVRAPVVLVAADERISRYRHPLPTPLGIQGRVMLVLVAEAWGLHVALTRFRGWTDDEAALSERWAAVRTVQAAMTEASVPGATLGAVMDVARQTYAASGYPDEWRRHHQGGTIAYHGRERVAVPGDPTIIEAGMALAWNPSITRVKVEDTILVQADGTSSCVTCPPALDGPGVAPTG